MPRCYILFCASVRYGFLQASPRRATHILRYKEEIVLREKLFIRELIYPLPMHF